MAIKEDKSFTGTQIGCRSFLQGKGHGVSVSTARCLSNVLNCFIQLSKNMKEEKSSFLFTALEKSRSVTNIQNFFLFLYHIGKESVILLS